MAPFRWPDDARRLDFELLRETSVWHILDIIACRSRGLMLLGRRLMALVHSDDRNLRIKPVGARPVLWNSTERVMHSRAQLEAARNREPS